MEPELSGDVENDSMYGNETLFNPSEATFIFSSVFVIFIPYIIVMTLYYLARKTDDRQPQHLIQINLMGCGVFCIIGTFFASLIFLILQSSQVLLTDPSHVLSRKIHAFLVRSMFQVVVNCPLMVSTAQYLLIFLIAYQRVVIIARARVSTQLLTGRRLNCKIFILYILATLTFISRTLNSKRVSWVEVISLLLALILLMVAFVLVRHIERRMIVSTHLTVIAQTLPLVMILIVFTTLEVVVVYFGESVIELRTLRALKTFTVSFATPLFMVLGSLLKRRIAWAVLTCRLDEQFGRGELYTADRTPAEYSNAVSLSPSPTMRF